MNHYGLHSRIGRGAPEIDILEVMAGERLGLPSTSITKPYFSSSFQVSPGKDSPRPNMAAVPKQGEWYNGLIYGDGKGKQKRRSGTSIKSSKKIGLGEHYCLF